MPNNNLSAFIAIWDEQFGAKIEDYYPKSIKLDFEQMTMQIFIAFQNFYYTEKEKDKKIKPSRSLVKLPFKSINRRSSIFLDSFEKSGEIGQTQPFIVVFLFPEYFSDEELEYFDNLIYKVGIEYIDLRYSPLKKHFNQINELFLLKEKAQDADIKIDENYSNNDALLDLKKGIIQFSKKVYEQAYFFLKKAHLKFKAENKIQLLLETSFFLGSILSQLKKIKIAREYFEQLEFLSNQLQHQKYYETAIFMEGFCSFKLENYEDALNQFKKLELIETQFINKFQFFYLYGRILRLMEQPAKAIDALLKAKDFSYQMDDSDDFKEKRARLLLELGHTSYNMAVEMIKLGKIDQDELNSYLHNTMDFYEESIKIWTELNNFKSLISTYQLIGNIYGLFNKFIESLVYYRKALKYTESTNDILSRMQIFNLIIQTLTRLEMHEIIIKEIDGMLSKIIAYAYIDLYTIAGFHRQLGVSLRKLGNKKEALSELLIAMNIYNKFDKPVEDILKVLQEIIEIYKESGEDKYIKYYENLFNIMEEKLKKMELGKLLTYGILGDVKEFWIIYNDGRGLFTFDPETSVDPDLFGSFMFALLNFSKDLTSKQLKSMSMGFDQFTFYKDKNKPFFIIGRSNIRSLSIKINLVLKNLSGEFWNFYEQDLADFSGEKKFSDFMEKLEKLKTI